MIESRNEHFRCFYRKQRRIQHGDAERARNFNGGHRVPASVTPAAR